VKLELVSLAVEMPSFIGESNGWYVVGIWTKDA
jgi:hypothetical protein